MTRLPWVVSAALAIAAPGCSGEAPAAGSAVDAGARAGSNNPRPATDDDASVPGRAAPRWRYLPALQASVPAGVEAVPVLEVANGRTGRARFLVAVARPAAAPDDPLQLRFELWELDQNNARGLLERTPDAPPEVVVRLRAAEPHAPALDRLREEIATPGVDVTRPRGLPVDGPEALLDALARAAMTARAGADAASRVAALAELARGVDDRVLLERDALYQVFEGMSEKTWRIESTLARSDRRVRARTAEPDALELEFLRTRDGWLLSDLRPAPVGAPE